MEFQKKREWFCLIVGTALMAIGIEGFLEHAKLVAGGITGIGIMLDAWSVQRFGVEIPLWLVNTVGNIPLFFYAWKEKGLRFMGRGMLTSLLFSLMLYIEGIFPIYSADPLLAAVFGGMAVGVGLGLVLSADSATGGVDLAATLLHMKWDRISVAQYIFIMDGAVILAGMALFGIESGLYAILAVYVTDRFINWVMEGLHAAEAAWIISEQREAIAAAILSELCREVTIFPVSRTYTGEGREVLFCVFSKKESHMVKTIIMNIDRNAFFLMMDVREVLGTGFSDK